MSMLAERKRKQKWSLNPRGKEWSEDGNKFGQKMLEKMGWQLGKGLGAKEDGVTEHVKVSYKNDSKGMGYKESNDQWTEHEGNFTALLKSLWGTENGVDDKKITSLEQKSQISRARVHYHKFTRGKDLSKASEKDLANIFGKKSLKATKKIEVANEKEDADSNKTESNSKFLLNAGSMKDYFQKKIPNFGKINGYVVGSNGVLKKEETDSESEARPSFGFGFQNTEKSTFVSYIDGKRKAEDNQESVQSPLKKSKKEKNKSNDALGVSNPAFNPLATLVKVQKHILDPIEESLNEELEDRSNVSSGNKKIKKCEQKLQSISLDSDSIEESPNKLNKNVKLDESCEEISINLTEYENTTDKYKKSKKKKKKILELVNPIFDDTGDNSVNSAQIDENPYEIITSKLKKKKKKSEADIKKTQTFNRQEENENTSFGDPKEISLSRDEKPDKLKKTKKKKAEDNEEKSSREEKKKKNKLLELDNPNFDDTDDNSVISIPTEKNPYEITTNKLRKNKKEKLNGKSKDTSINTCIKENPYEVKVKKTKKQKTIEIDNPNFDDTEDNTSITNTSELEENPYEIKTKEKKKKNKNKNLAIDNPSFVDQEEKSIEHINPYEVKQKKKNNKESGVANPALDMENSKTEDSINFDLMLNVVSTPIVAKQETAIETRNKLETSRRRKSVRFSDVTQEMIIPNNKDMKEMYAKNKKTKKGLDNLNFDKQQNDLDENVDTISKKLDSYQAEIENDMNEEKIKSVTVDDLMVGEVGNPKGENEETKDGTKLKFKYANLDKRVPFYQLNKVGAKKSYKHLIKGDILLKFKNSNLHEVKGYGQQNKA